MRDVYVLGVGMIKFGRYPDKDVPQLGADAALLALKDAGMTIKDVELLVCGNLFQANAMNAQRILQQIGQTGIPALNVSNACATGSTAFREAYIGEGRVACSKCTADGQIEEIKLSDRGTLYVYSIVHQSVPGVPVPYVSAIVDLPEGVSVRCNLVDVEPDPAKVEFGMPVEMITRKVRERKEKNAEGVEETIDIVAFFFRPSQN